MACKRVSCLIFPRAKVNPCSSGCLELGKLNLRVAVVGKGLRNESCIRLTFSVGLHRVNRRAVGYKRLSIVNR